MDSISEVLSSVYTDSELKHAIEILDEQSVNGLEINDRTARTQIEERYLSQVGASLAQMRPLAESLETINRNTGKQRRIFGDISNVISNLNSSVALFAAEASFLEEENSKIARQQRTLEAVMDRIYLKPAEAALLSDPDTGLTPEFLAAFTKAKTVREAAAPVLLAEAPRAGELLMLEIAQLLDAAYVKIRFAIEHELKRKNSDAMSEGSSTLRQYMVLLADRPLLFKAVLENQSGTRKAKILRDFTQFINRESVNAALMPVRFLGSVLAWIHAAVVNELENISLLLDPGEEAIGTLSGGEKHAQLAELLSTSNPHQIVTGLVDQITGSVEPVAKQHLSSLVFNQADPAVIDEMQNVLLFYRHTMLQKYEQPTLDALFDQLSQTMEKQFIRLLPSVWDDRVGLALSLIQTYETGVHSDTGLVTRLGMVLDAALEQELADADALSGLNTLDAAISHLAGHLLVQPKLEQFKEREEQLIAKQVAIEVSQLKQASKFAEYQVSALSAREFMAHLESFLSEGGQNLALRLDSLSSPSIAHRIAKMAVDEFVNQYDFATRDAPGITISPEGVRELLN